MNLLKKHAPSLLCLWLLFMFLCYQLNPELKHFFQSSLLLLQKFDIYGLKELLLSYGYFAFGGAVALVAVQSVVPFLPGMALTIVNAWLFGWQLGAVCTWFGALLGALIDFVLARVYGKKLVERILPVRQLAVVDRYMEQHGIAGIIASRLIPVIPFKIVSYGCGLSNVSWTRFSAATALGQTPGIMVYSFLGQYFFTDFKILCIISGIFIFVGLLFYLFRESFYRLPFYHWLKSF